MALDTKEDFPHLLGEIIAVFVSEPMFAKSLAVSFSLSVKSSAATILPYTKGTYIRFVFANIGGFYKLYNFISYKFISNRCR